MNEKTQELAIVLLRTYILQKHGGLQLGNLYEVSMISLSIASKVIKITFSMTNFS